MKRGGADLFPTLLVSRGMKELNTIQIVQVPHVYFISMAEDEDGNIIYYTCTLFSKPKHRWLCILTNTMLHMPIPCILNYGSPSHP